MASSSLSDSPHRYIFEAGGENYARVPLPVFRSGDLITRRRRRRHQTSTSSTETGEVHSVTENVEMLEYALRRSAAGLDPFDNDWVDDVATYCDDLLRRVWPIVFRNRGVGFLRDRAMDYAMYKIAAGLRSYIISNTAVDGPSVHGHGWVFCLLEHRHGNALTHCHEFLPDEGEDRDHEHDEELLLDALNFLFQAKSQAMETIERICSAHNPMQRFQYFDIEGEELDVTEAGLQRKATTARVGSSRAPGDYASQAMLDECLLGASDGRTHEIIIDLGEQEWEAISVGLGAGYVCWRVNDTASGHRLLGFSSEL
ncbi:MAG: hypothetical protein Q9217_005252 [Psora testacea]